MKKYSFLKMFRLNKQKPNNELFAVLVTLFIFSMLLLFVSCEETDDALEITNITIEENNSHPNAASYQQIIDDFLEAGVPGVSVTVRSPDGIWSKCGGKADLKNDIDLTPNHTLRIGSMTKVFTATTLLILQDEGILSIDDKINEYIPSSITNHIKNANEVTIRQLLNHTSGIRDYLGLQTTLAILNLSIKKYSAEENLKLIYDKKAAFSPGKGKEYCNSNYLLAALVIKYATGKSANEVVQEKIIEQLALENTFISTAEPSTLSRAYYGIYDDGYMKDVTEIDMNAVGGEDMLDGGIISNSYDISIFLEALLTGQILSDTSLDEMEEFTEITEDLGDMDYITKYGLGLMYLDTENGVCIGHYGNVYGFNGVYVYYPEIETTLAVIINGYSGKISKVLDSEDIFKHLFE